MPVTIVDIAVALLVILSALFAMTRGFTREVFSLLSWAAAAAVTFYGYFLLREPFYGYVQIRYVSDAILIVGLFLVSLLLLSLVTSHISDKILDSQVGGLDRALGLVFGIGRALLIGAVGIFLFDAALQNPRAHPDMVKQAKTVPMLRTVRDKIAYGIIGLFPKDFERSAIERYRDTFASDPPGAAPQPGTDAGTPSPSEAAPQTIEDLLENNNG